MIASAKKSRTLKLAFLLIAVCFLLTLHTGCLEFESIDQPSSVVAGETFTVFIEVIVTNTEYGYPMSPYFVSPYFGICLPLGWTIPGDAITCMGVYNEVITYDSNLSLEQEAISPAPEGYYWWVGYGDAIETEEGSVFGTIQIQTDEQTGIFSIDYMLGNLQVGLNQQRSDGQVIVIIDIHTPTGLQAIVEGESVYLSWSAPQTSEELIGYLVYRDGEVINFNLGLDAFYLDDNPGVGIHNYTVASFYNDGNVCFAPEILEVFVCEGGTGEPGNPYQIATANQLTAIGSHPSLLNKHYVLISDIDLDPNLSGRHIFDRAVIAPDTSDIDEDFQGSTFTGTFDGNDHTVSNLTIEGNSYLGLFGALGPEAQVKNVNLVNVDVTGNSWHIGAITGYSSGTVQECYSSGFVMGHSNVGGLVGCNDNGHIINSDSCTVVIGIEYVGGLLGFQLANRAVDATVFNSFATGEVFAWQWIGGLVGFNQGTVSNCSASNLVNGSSFLGGLVGYNDTTGLLSNCYSCSTVLGEDTLGGLVGYNIGSICFTYSAGEVSGVSNVGGLVGNSDAQAEVIASFWDTEVSGQLSSDGGTGLTTSEMQTSSTYQLWGTYENAGIWTIDEGRDYPRLWWENIPGEPIAIGAALSELLMGTGTEDNPYLIYNAEELNLISLFPRDWNKHFMLMADIDMSGYLYTSAVIAPDDDSYTWYISNPEFRGIFDGNGHTISHLTIEGESSLGLFGGLASGAEVSNLGLLEVNISSISRSPVGALAGWNSGTITSCYSTGTVSGDQNVGGLVGENRWFGSITTSYSTGTVSGDRYIGGLVGRNNGSITTSYSTGTVSGDRYVGGLVGYNLGRRNNGSITTSYSTGTVSGDWYVGGLVGYNYYNDSSISISFWNKETSGQVSSDGGTGLTTAEMQDINTYLDAGWDFVDETSNGTHNFWIMREVGYPGLAVFFGYHPTEPNGSGTFNDPYVLMDANDLGFIFYSPGAHYRLEADIDLSGITWSMAVVSWFEGTFEGNDHVISNLHIKGGDYLGLFGQLDSGASISNLSLEAVDIDGTGDYVGGLVGFNRSTLTSCYSTGTVSGNDYVGGLVGYNGNTLTSCDSSGIVNGNDYVGGLVGRNSSDITISYSSANVTGSGKVGGLAGENSGRITTCCSDGIVSGDWYIGGLAGKNVATIKTSYSTSTVTGNRTVGGFVGRNDYRSRIFNSYSTGLVIGNMTVGGFVGRNIHDIYSCYWDMETSGQTISDGGEGKTTAEMQTAGTFLEAGWDFMFENANGTEDIWWIFEDMSYPRLWWELIPIE